MTFIVGPLNPRGLGQVSGQIRLSKRKTEIMTPQCPQDLFDLLIKFAKSFYLLRYPAFQPPVKSKILKAFLFVFSSGVIQNTLGNSDVGPWPFLDQIETMMDYFTLVLGPAFFNYSVSYGNEQFSIPAICELGKLILYSEKYIFND